MRYRLGIIGEALVQVTSKELQKMQWLLHLHRTTCPLGVLSVSARCPLGALCVCALVGRLHGRLIGSFVRVLVCLIDLIDLIG